MTHLEKHIAAVRTRLFAGLLLDAMSWSALMLAAAGLLLVVIDRLFAVSLPTPWRWPVVITAIVACFLVSILAAWVRRPTQQAAAVAIDAKLSLKERFSTAIYASPSSEPFAMAAVHDAEETARRVDLARQFPLKIGRQWRATAVLLGLSIAAGIFMPRVDLFGHGVQVAAKIQQEDAQQMARANVNKALAVVSAAAKWKNEDELGALIEDLRKLAKLPKIADTESANRKARRAIDLAQGTSPNAARDPGAGDTSPFTSPMENGDDVATENAKPSSGKTDHSATSPKGGQRVAADRLAESELTNPNTNPGGAGKANGNNPLAGNNPPGNNNAPGNAPGQPGNANNNAAGNQPGQGAPNNNNAPGIAGAGDRPKQVAPFAVAVQQSPSQDLKEGKIIARDLINSRAPVGEQTARIAKVVQAAREEAADEIDIEHVSGPAQSAARKYFRTMENTPLIRKN